MPVKPKTKVQDIINKGRERSTTLEDVKTYTKNVEAYMKDVNQLSNPSCQVSAKLLLNEKTALYNLIRSKGCDGLTSFLRMLSKAKEVEITL